MAIEIERKFLVENDGWKSSAIGSSRIRDGLLMQSPVSKLRVRIKDGGASLTLKTPRDGVSRAEFEYSIPAADAEEMMRLLCDHTLEKTRHLVTHGNMIWQVDVYDGLLKGVVLAEIELSSEDQSFELPEWTGREVTNDASYRKINMVRDRLGKRRKDSAAPDEERR